MYLCIVELDLYQAKGKFPADAVLIAIDDPKPGVGSGSATLNALLVITEHLSARAGYTVMLLPSFSMVHDGCVIPYGVGHAKDFSKGIGYI